MKTKTRWTLAEARTEAFKQFPVQLNRYELSRYAVSDGPAGECSSYWGDLIMAAVTGDHVWKSGQGRVKLTRKQIQYELEAHMRDVFAEDTLRRWCSANRIQRYQVDGEPWFEKWGERGI